MGNLALTPGTPLNMSTVTISVWFRVPTASSTEVQARDVGLSEDIEVLNEVIPIMMWGTQQTSTIWEDGAATASCGPYPATFTDSLSYISGSHSAPAQQSCIGVRCHLASPTLYVHLQPDHGATCVNSSSDIGPGYTCTFPGVLGPDGATRVVHPDVTDSSYVDESIEEGAVGNSSAGEQGPEGGTPSITLDEWHHLLISWDLGVESASSVTDAEALANKPYNERISTTSTLYCALDDVNKNGADLPASWIGTIDDIGDPNSVACSEMFYIAGLQYDPAAQVPYVGGLQTAATASITHGTIPAQTLWIPAPLSVATQSRGTIAGNLKVETAELQIFCGIALDTSVELNRRAFITSELQPANVALAASLMGQAPDVLLHGSNNWINGLNTGSLAMTPVATGTITAYTPNP